MNNNLTACKTVNGRRTRSVKAILFSICICGELLSIVFSTQISTGIVKTATATAKTVIPSLFPFMVISSFMTDSGLCSVLEIFPGKLLEKTAHIKKEVTGAVVLGLISGFPIGVSTVCDIYKSGKISKEEAEAALCQAHNTGPGFPISFIGTYLWGSPAFGISVYLSQVLSMVLLSRLIFKRAAVTDCSTYKIKSHINYTKSLSDAIAKSAVGCLSICASVVFWKTVCGLFTVFTPVINASILSVFEFSSGASSAAAVGGLIGALLTGFSIGFGGLAAMFQGVGFAAECGLSVRKVFKFKAAQGVLCGLFTVVSYLIIK